MNLQPERPGLWVNQDWTPGTPGTFVMIIGVSQYDHLPGGNKVQAEQNHGLSSLFVSALTAWEFFTWIRDGYTYTPPNASPCPVAKCWLLLSPTLDELNHRPDMAQNALRPTFDKCDKAILRWNHAMKQLPQAAAAKSRTFFFFSGHGLEITQDEQILLPCDYLKPIYGDYNKAINTRRLSQALTVLPIDEQFFFVDACRNDHQELRDLMITGSGIITTRQSFQVRSCNRPILYSSISGDQTYQPTHIGEDLSLFGQAVLDGLKGKSNLSNRESPRINLDCDERQCAVQYAFLHEFVRQRVHQLLKKYGSSVTPKIPLSNCTEPFATLTYLPVSRSTVQPQAPLSEILAEGFSERQMLDWWNPHHASKNAHNIFGRETVTDMWKKARVYSFRQKKWLDSTQAYHIHQVEHTPKKSEYRVTLSLASSSGIHWFEMQDSEKTFGCLLPDDEHTTPRFTFGFTIDDHPNHYHPVARFDVNLSLNNSGPLKDVAALWERYETVSLSDAISHMDARQLNTFVDRKVASPLSATVAALILLRAGRIDMLPQSWMENLAEWFPEHPDGPVLLNEYRLQIWKRVKEMEQVKLMDSLWTSMSKPVPCCMAEAFGYAVKQARDLAEFGMLPPELKDRADVANKQMGLACRYFRPGGLLTVFAGPTQSLYDEFLSHLLT